MNADTEISYRPLQEGDLNLVPLQCQGDITEVRERIRSCGSSAMLAFDGGRSVGQLQFRPYVAGTRSPQGIHHPLYWMDYPEPAPALPQRTLSLFCYHVGQLEDDPEQRDPRYLGRGIGQALLQQTIAWALDRGYTALVAKGLAQCWPLIQYMGGMPGAIYDAHGFECVSTALDPDIRQLLDEMLMGAYGAARLRELQLAVDQGADLDEIAVAGIWLLRMRNEDV